MQTQVLQRGVKKSRVFGPNRGAAEMAETELDKEIAGHHKTKPIEESERLRRLNDVRAPVINEVMAENPGLTREQLVKMMDEMGF
jgi:hypothetical protein